MEERLSPLAQAIFASLTLSNGHTKGELRLPAMNAVCSLELEATISELLRKKFQIRLNSSQEQHIWQGTSLHFSVPSPAAQPIRTCSINFDAVPPTITILGTPPLNGEDGSAEAAFDWRRHQGNLTPEGIVDWRDINDLLTTERGALIATVLDRTAGAAGIDCFGREIKAVPGLRPRLRWPRNHFYRDDEKLEAREFKLYANCAGVIGYSFRDQNDPRTLDSLHITETLKILSDIDGSTGDIDSPVSLDIAGSIHGNFRLRAKGFIHVRDGIDSSAVFTGKGQPKTAAKICTVEATEEIETGSIIHAEARARNIFIRENAALSHLNAGEKLHFLPGANLAGLTMQGCEIIFDRCTFSGRNLLRLGAELFDSLQTMLTKIDSGEAQLDRLHQKAADCAKKILQHVAELKKYCDSDMTLVMKNLFHELGEHLADSVQRPGLLKPPAVSLLRELLALFLDKGYGPSILRFAEQLLERFADYDTLQGKNLAAAEKMKASSHELLETENKIKNNLVIHITAPKIFGKNTTLQIKCGNAELLIFGNELKGRNREIRYFAPGNDHELTEGRLDVLKY